MSRIGRLPVSIPAGVTFEVADNNQLTVKGPKGTLTASIHPNIQISQEGTELHIIRMNDEKLNKSLHGMSRTIINNMMVGVTKGFVKTLEIEGVGYKAQKQGKKLVLNLGYSHPVEFTESENITIEVPAPNRIIISGIDKQRVGQIAADIRETRKPEPYHGKGIRYQGEVVQRKEGKTGKK